MSTDTRPSDWMPARPGAVAAVICVLVACTLAWPMFTGQFLAGPHSDQFIAGYGFRLFGAEEFRRTGAIPLWNPFLFGGMPFVGAMHGDIFYPTAWLRWVLPTDLAMTLGFVGHLVVAGIAMYTFLRVLGTSWGGAIVGGVAYELAGMTASMVHPGHDGKLFVTALTPLLFLALVRAVRDRRLSGYGLTALCVGLTLHGHPQLSYYLLVAAGLWTLWLIFGDTARDRKQTWWIPLAGAAGAVAVGVGIYAIQLLPGLDYVPFSPRGPGGPSGGWEYATAYSLPFEELMVTVLPQFNGMVEAYWGRNGIKLHSEYLGGLVLILAALGVATPRRVSLKLALVGIAGLFLLIALGAQTPFYRLWYALPMMKQVRAPGTAFFLVSFVTAIFAAWGAERLLRREIRVGRLVTACGVLAGLGLLGAVGLLQPVAEGIAQPELMTRAIANASELQQGGVRLLAVMLIGGATFLAIARGRLQGAIAVLLLAGTVAADLWTIDRRYFVFSPPAAVTYADDALTAVMREDPLPWRAWDPAGQFAGLGVYYAKSWLMAYRIPTLLAYHGNELRSFDELLGGKNAWASQVSPNIWDLYAVKYLLLGQEQTVPGFHKVAGPVPVTLGGIGSLYAADSATSWVRVVPGAAKLPEAQIAPTVTDVQFPINSVVLLPDTVSIDVAPIDGVLPEPAAVTANLASWEPGRMRVTLSGRDERTTYLLIGENWYPGWRATVDGVEVPPLRGNHALLVVPLPPGSREVSLVFTSPPYTRGKAISAIALAGTLLLLVGGSITERRGRALHA